MDHETFAKKFIHGRLLLLLSEHDAPKIERQNSKFLKQIQYIVDAKMEVVKGTDHFTLVENLHQVESESSKTLLSFLHAP